jgi:hypothetical protein
MPNPVRIGRSTARGVEPRQSQHALALSGELVRGFHEMVASEQNLLPGDGLLPVTVIENNLGRTLDQQNLRTVGRLVERRQPLLNVDLALVGFFVVAPLLLLIFHFYLFLQLLGLASKAKDYNTLLVDQAPCGSVQNLSQCAGRPAMSSRCKSDTMKE